MNHHALFFKAFSNQTRLEIIKTLKKNSLTVTELSKQLGFEQSRVSHNLRCLEHCGFVSAERNGKWKRYSLDKETILPMVSLFEKHIVKYKKRLARCAEFVK